MRAILLVILMGLLLVSACVPPDGYPMGTATPSSSPKPTVTSTPGTIPDGNADQIEPAPTKTPTATEVLLRSTAFDGEEILKDRCIQCHRLSRVTGASQRAEAWRSTVERMVNYGAVLNTEEFEALVQYLAGMYP